MIDNKKALMNSEKSDKTVIIAITFAIFGILLFLALALTVPWGK